MRKNAAIELDINKNIENGVKFYAKQFDDLKLKVKIFDGVKEVDVLGQDAIVFIVKEDKTVIEQRDNITIEDNALVVNLTKQATTALGKCSMEILLRDEEGTSSTSTVSYVVGEKLSATIVEIIQSEDDIHALNIIEEFIQNSNIDMIEIKEAVRVLRETVENAQGEIEADIDNVKAEALTEILESAEKALEEINAVKDEILDEVDRASEKAAEAVEKATETLDTITGIKEEIDAINNTVSEAIETIETTKGEAIDEIASAVVVIEDSKEEAVNLVSTTKTNAISSIVDEKAGAINEIGTTKVEAVSTVADAGATSVGEVNTAKVRAVEEVESAEVGVIAHLEEKAEKIKNDLDKYSDDLVSGINTDANTIRVNTIEVIDAEAIEIKSGIIKDIEDSIALVKDEVVSSVSTELNEAKDSAINEVSNSKDVVVEEVKTELATEKGDIIAEATEELEVVKAGAVSDINAVKDEVIAEVQSGIDTVKEEAINGINAVKDTALDGFDDELEVLKSESLNGFNSELDTLKNNVVGNINTVKDTGIADITEKLSEINSELESLTLVKDEILSSNEAGEVVLTGLLDAIRRAEEITGEVEAYIESKSGNHDEILAELDAIKISIEELRAGVSTVGFIDRMGAGLYKEVEDESYINVPEPDFEPVHTFKYQYYTNSNTFSYAIYFKTSLVDNENKKYLYMNNNDITSTIQMNNITKDDYVCYRFQHGSTSTTWTEIAPIMPELSNKRTKIYHHDFPIYNMTGDAIIFEDSTKTGVSDFDLANIDGDYSINLSQEDFNSLYNGIKVSGDKTVVGSLNVKTVGANKVQTLYLNSHGLTYMRVVGQEWRDISSGAISKSPLDNIKISEEGLPEFLRDIPPLPMYGQEVVDTLIFQTSETSYNVYRFLNGWSGKVYYAGSTSFYVNVPTNKVYRMTYNSSTGVWNTSDIGTGTSNVGSISVTKAYFKVFYNTMQITTSSSATTLYQDITVPETGEVSIMNFDNAVNTGIYKVSINNGDAIANSPLTYTTEQLEDESTREVVSEDLEGILQVFELGNDVYQELLSNDNYRAWKRTRINGVWTDWRIIVTEAMFYNILNAR